MPLPHKVTLEIVGEELWKDDRCRGQAVVLAVDEDVVGHSLGLGGGAGKEGGAAGGALRVGDEVF